jgi:hypothetical protein
MVSMISMPGVSWPGKGRRLSHPTRIRREHKHYDKKVAAVDNALQHRDRAKFFTATG